MVDKAQVGKAYRILSPLIGTPHRDIHVGKSKCLATNSLSRQGLINSTCRIQVSWLELPSQLPNTNDWMIHLKAN